MPAPDGGRFRSALTVPIYWLLVAISLHPYMVGHIRDTGVSARSITLVHCGIPGQLVEPHYRYANTQMQPYKTDYAGDWQRTLIAK